MTINPNALKYFKTYCEICGAPSHGTSPAGQEACEIHWNFSKAEHPAYHWYKGSVLEEG
jgi:hypothetical protein